MTARHALRVPSVTVEIFFQRGMCPPPLFPPRPPLPPFAPPLAPCSRPARVVITP